MLAKTLFLIIISSLLSLSATSPLPAAQDHTDNSRESGELNVTSPSSSSGNVKRAPATKLVLNLIGCTTDVITWASYNPGRLTAKEDGILYGSVIPRGESIFPCTQLRVINISSQSIVGGLYFAVDPKDADVIGRASNCPGGRFVVAEYDFDGTGLRIVDMTAGQHYDETAHAVVGWVLYFPSFNLFLPVDLDWGKIIVISIPHELESVASK
ncbi:hypothetical protein GGU11DRAFT_528405 [Lentinula aff. detonsa]|nr:hypothetical protein GGU11DRAFT_528405 [Lentinula aff. detonsa]